MIAQLAWKNVWRNKTRSMVVVAAVAFGCLSGLFAVGLMNGWVDQRVHAVIETELGDIQLSNPRFIENPEVVDTLQQSSEIAAFLSEQETVFGFSAYSQVFAMAATSRGSAGLNLVGIDPNRERVVSDLYTRIVPNGGSYFEKSGRQPFVVISERMAEELRLKNFRLTDKVLDSLAISGVSSDVVSKLSAIKGKRFFTKKRFKTALKSVITEQESDSYGAQILKIAQYLKTGAKIVFTLTDVSGNLVYQSFRVEGIYRTDNSRFDMQNAFVQRQVLNPLIGLKDSECHGVTVRLNEQDSDSEPLIAKLKAVFPESSVQSWKELAPDAGMLAEFMGIYNYVIIGFIFFALAFGIINTMLMAILERIRELGMLMAIGMKKKKVFVMIMLETVFLTFTGSFVGMILGFILIKITGRVGINFSAAQDGLESLGWSSVVYPSITALTLFGITVLVVVVAIVSSIVPARKALQIEPIEAVRMQ